MNELQKKGKLYLIPTPLAENSNDHSVTAYLREVVRETNYYLVENPRTARRFISSLKLGIVIESLHFEQLDKNSTFEQVSRFCQPLLEGCSIGVMSEAGCPGIADPGSLAVNFAHEHSIEVIPLVGPSSIFMALMASGFNGQSFIFHGYLPIEKGARRQKIKALEQEALNKKQTQIFMETPYRNNQLLEDLVKNCKPFVRLCVAKNLMSKDTLIATKSIKDWGKTTVDLHKSPTIFLLYNG